MDEISDKLLIFLPDVRGQIGQNLLGQHLKSDSNAFFSQTERLALLDRVFNSVGPGNLECKDDDLRWELSNPLVELFLFSVPVEHF